MVGFLRKMLGRSGGESALLQPGAVAPDFRVTAHDGRTISLGDFRGKKVVLWFYPKADTPHCTLQGKGLGAEYGQFESAGAVVLGVSVDTQAANKAFAEKFSFPFPLLCDTDRRIAVAYGACDSPKAGHARRITYVIDEAGIIRHVLPKVDPTTHTADVLALVR